MDLSFLTTKKASPSRRGQGMNEACSHGLSVYFHSCSPRGRWRVQSTLTWWCVRQEVDHTAVVLIQWQLVALALLTSTQRCWYSLGTPVRSECTLTGRHKGSLMAGRERPDAMMFLTHRWLQWPSHFLDFHSWAKDNPGSSAYTVMVDVKPEWVPGVYETGACTQEQSGALLYPINVHPGHSERANEEGGDSIYPKLALPQL